MSNRAGGVVLGLVILSFLRPAFAKGDDETRTAVASFKKAYASKEALDRAKAVDELGAIQHKLVVEALTGPITKDPAPAVRRAAAKVLGAQGTTAAAIVLAKALDAETEHDVETAIIMALGETGTDAAVPALVARLVAKRRGATAPAGEEEPSADTGPALEALKRLGSSLAIEDVLVFLSKDAAMRAKRRGSDPPGPLTKLAEATLESLTGQRKSGIAEWRRWWNENKDTLKTVPVYRCDESGKTFDRATPTAKCPHCEHQGKCGTFVRTRLEGVPDASSPKK